MYTAQIYRITVETSGSRVSYLKAFSSTPRFNGAIVLGNALYQENEANLSRSFTYVCFVEAENYSEFKKVLRKVSLKEKTPIEFVEFNFVKLFNGREEFVLRKAKRKDF